MKTNQLLLALGLAMLVPGVANAHNPEMVEITDITISEVDCKTLYNTNWNENWFIQVGAGFNMPFVENTIRGEKGDRQLALALNVGAGRWFSPYMGFRFSALGGELHWENGSYSKAKYANMNLDFMWDMMNSVGGVNARRVFSINPFVGLGGTYVWNMESSALNVRDNDGKIRNNTWVMPVSAGIQFRFRTCPYFDIFVEARGQFYGDNFNGTVGGRPVDINFSTLGGFSFNIGGMGYTETDPCTYVGYMNSLNDEVNSLRYKLAKTNNELAAAKAQLPCPEPIMVNEVEVIEVEMPIATVRFALNSAKISNEQMVNVYNVAQWLDVSPMATITICGYADDQTGSPEYNMKLSEQRAKAVMDTLVNEYGIDAGRLTIKAYGSETQPYETNNWNRIVIFQNN